MAEAQNKNLKRTGGIREISFIGADAVVGCTRNPDGEITAVRLLENSSFTKLLLPENSSSFHEVVITERGKMIHKQMIFLQLLLTDHYYTAADRIREVSDRTGVVAIIKAMTGVELLVGRDELAGQDSALRVSDLTIETGYDPQDKSTISLELSSFGNSGCAMLRVE